MVDLGFSFFVFNVFRLGTGLEYDLGCSPSLGDNSSVTVRIPWNEDSNVTQDHWILLRNDSNTENLIYLGTHRSTVTSFKHNPSHLWFQMRIRVSLDFTTWYPDLLFGSSFCPLLFAQLLVPAIVNAVVVFVTPL